VNTKNTSNTRLTIEIIIGVITSSGLLSLWIISYLSPILSAKSELALLSAKILKKETEYQKIINDEKTLELNNKIITINKKLKIALSSYEKSQKQLKRLEVSLQNKQKEHINQSNNNSLITEKNEFKIKDLEAKIQKIRKERKENDINIKQLNNILTYTELNGLWKTDGTINNKNAYIEFLPKGTIRTYEGLDGKSFIASNQKWLLEDNQIIILTEQNDKELKNTGKLINGTILGTREWFSGDKTKWILKRTR
jgi:hypothetical protein